MQEEKIVNWLVKTTITCITLIPTKWSDSVLGSVAVFQKYVQCSHRKIGWVKRD